MVVVLGGKYTRKGNVLSFHNLLKRANYSACALVIIISMISLIKHIGILSKNSAEWIVPATLSISSIGVSLWAGLWMPVVCNQMSKNSLFVFISSKESKTAILSISQIVALLFNVIFIRILAQGLLPPAY